MKDVLQTYKFNFEFNTKDSKKQLKAISDDVIKMLSDMDSASNKMKIFNNLVGYIERLDSALNQFKAMHKDDFENMFGGLDAQLSKSLEAVLGLDSKKLGQLSGLRERIDSALANKAGVKELRPIAQDINALFASIGEQGPINIDEWFTGKGKNLEQRIGYLNEKLYDFYMSYQLITRSIKGGLGEGGASGFSALGDEARKEAEEIKEAIKEFNETKRQLDDAKEALKKVDKKSSKTPEEYKIDLTAESVQGLIAEFDRLNNEIMSGDKSSKEYYDNLVKMSEVIIKLKGALKDINANADLKKLFVDTKSGKGDTMLGQLSTYANTKSFSFIESFLGKNASDGIQRVIDSYIGRFISTVQNTSNYAPQHAGQVGSGGGGPQADSEQVKQLKQEHQVYIQLIEDVNKLVDAKRALDDFDEPTQFSGTKDVEELMALMREYATLKNIITNSEDKSSVDYYKSLIQFGKVAVKLYSTAANSSDKFLDLLNNNPIMDRSLVESLGVGTKNVSLGKDKGFDTNLVLGRLSNQIEGIFTDNESDMFIGDALPKALQAMQLESARVADQMDSLKQVGTVAQESRQQVDALSEALTNTFIKATQLELEVKGGKQTGKEYMNLFSADGTMSEVAGTDKLVDTDDIVGQLVANLKNSMVMSLHNHANGNDVFSPQDVESFAKLYYGQGVKLNGIIADGMVKTIDFSDISQDVAIKIAQSYSENLQRLVQKHSNLLTWENGSIGYTDMAKQLEVANPEVYQDLVLGVSDQINEALRNAFIQNGVEPTIQQFEYGQLPQLVEHLKELQTNAQSALDPVEKIKSLMSALYPDKSFDWSQYTEILDKFNSGDIDGKTAIEQILNFKPNTQAIDKQSKAIEQQTQSIEKQNESLEENKRLQKQQTGAVDDSLITDDVASELAQLESLRSKISQCKEEVDQKTAAFKEEATAVSESVLKEIQDLENLKTQIKDVATSVENLISQITSSNHIFDAWRADLVLVEQSVNDIANKIANIKYPAQISDIEPKKVDDIVQQQKKVDTDAADVHPEQKHEVAQIDDKSIQDEAVMLDDLLKKVNVVDQAVKQKTSSFREEGTIVEQVAEQEVASLGKLESALDKVKSAVKDNTQAFKDEGKAAEQAAKQAESAQKKQESETKQDNSQSSSGQGAPSGKKTSSKITPEQKADKTIYAGALNQYRSVLQKEMKKLDFTSLDEGLSDSQKEIANLYNNTIKQIEQYTAAVKNGESVELSSIQKAVAALKEKAKAYKEQNNLTDSGAKKSKPKTPYGQNAVAITSGKYNSLQAKINDNEYLAESSILQTKFSEYESALTKVRNLYNSLKDIDPTEGDKEAFRQASAECNNLGRDVEKLIKEYEKLHNDPNKIGEQSLDGFVNTQENRKQALLDYVQTMHGARATIGNFTDAWHGLEYTIDNGDGTFVKAKASIDNLGTAIVETAGDTQKAVSKFEKLIGTMSSKFKELWVYTVSRFGVDELIQQVRQGIQYVREIDAALTELKKVTNETEEVYNNFLNTMSKTAGKVGSTVSELTTMAAEWARLGYSIGESAKLAESTAILLNVSEFKNATEASEALISTMQAFQYTADDSQRVVDILNEVGNNYAVSSDGLAIALQDSASALMEAGNNLEQSVALIAAANKVVQDPNSVGSALRTISLRLRGTSVKVLEEMGEETDGVVESISKMQDKIKALTGVNILTDSGAYKDTYTILKEIGTVWKEMSDIDQAALLELMAGKNRANTLAAILGNMEDLTGAYQTASEAEGSALRENEAYLESIQGHIDVFNNSLQTMWMNFLNTDAIKWFVHLGTALLNAADNVGLIETALIGVVGYLTLIKKFDWKDFFSFKSSSKAGKIDLLGGEDLEKEIGNLNNAIKQGPEAFNDYKNAMKNTNNGMYQMIQATDKAEYTTNDYTQALKNMTPAAAKTARNQEMLNVAIGLGVMAMTAIIGLIEHYADSIEDLEESYDNLQSSISSLKGDIDSIDSQLSALDEQIDALSNKNLSLVEAEELKRLKEQSAELQRQKELQEGILKAREKQNQAKSLAMINKMLKTTAAHQEDAAESGKAWGSAIGVIAGALVGVLAVAAAPFTGGGSLFAGAGLAGSLAGAGGLALTAAGLGAAGGSKLGEAAGGAIGSKSKESGDSLIEWYESYEAAIAEAERKAAEAEQKYFNDATDDNYEKWQNKMNEVNTLQTEMYDGLEELQEYVGNLEYNDSTKEIIDGYNDLLIHLDVKNNNGNIDAQISSIESLASEYYRLSQGVDENGKNIALTTEEYARYCDIVGQVLSYTPGLIQGYDAEGNAILGAVDARYTYNQLIAESLELLKEQRRQEAANAVSEAALNKVVDDSNSKYDAAIKGAANYDSLTYNEDNYNLDQTMDIIESKIGVKQNGWDRFWGIKEAEYVLENAEKIAEHKDEILQAMADSGTYGSAGVKQYSEWLDGLIQASRMAADQANAEIRERLYVAPQASEYYDDLSGSQATFINSYIAGLENLKDKSKKEIAGISESIVLLTDTIGTNKHAQDLIDDLFSINPSKMPVQKYKDSVNQIFAELIDDGIITEDQKASIYTQLFPDMENINTMQSKVAAKLKANSKGLIKNLSLPELEIAYKYLLTEADDSMSFEDLKQKIAEFNTELDGPIVATYSDLSQQVSDLNEILLQSSEIVLDNTQVTQEYKDALIELGVSEEELAECFDDTNKLVVTNAKKLNDLTAKARKNTAQNVQLAKSQARLQYYELFKQMQGYVTAQGVVREGHYKEILALYNEMNALEKTIAKYETLEVQLLGTVTAYEKFQKAQEVDASTDYIAQTEDMLLALGQAFNTAELGTEAAQAAIAGLVPESVYKDLDTVDEKMAAIYEYFKKGKLSQYYSLEFDDDGGISSAEMKLGNLRKFIEDGLADGGPNVFDGEDWQHFDFSDEFLSELDALPEGADKLQYFSDKMNVTKDVAFAFIKALEDHDIEWLNGDYSTMFEDFIPETLEGNIFGAMEKIADLNAKLASGEIDAEAYTEQFKLLNAELESAKKESRTNMFGADGVNEKTPEQIDTMPIAEVDNYFDANQKVINATEDAEEAAKKYQEALEELNKAREEGKESLEDEQKAVKDAEAALDSSIKVLDEAIQKKQEFKEPTEAEIQIVLDDIESEIAAAGDKFDKALADNFDLDENGYYTIKAGLNSSDLDSKFPGIIEYVNLLNSRTQLTAHADTADAEVGLKNLNDTLTNIQKILETVFKVQVDTSGAVTKTNSFKTLWDSIKSKAITLWTSIVGGGNLNGTANVGGTAYATGTAHKSGNWGLPKDEHNSLVGELGPEMVVDPSSGRYYTVGDTGAEMVDLPKGAIIFNHKQTEGLLKNGRITSRGKAYAEGNAHLTIFDDGSSKGQWEGTGYDNGDDPTWDASEALSDAAKSVSDAADEFKEVFDWIEVRLENINADIDLEGAKLENQVGYQDQNASIEELIKHNEKLFTNLQAAKGYYDTYAAELLKNVDSKYRDLAQNGSIDVEVFKDEIGEKQLEAIKEYREWLQKCRDVTQQAEETITEISALAKQAIDNIAQDFENQRSLNDNQLDQYDAYNSLLETDKGFESEKIYEEMIKVNDANIKMLEEQRNAMQAELNKRVESGEIKKFSQDWYDAVNDIAAVDTEIIELKTDTEDWQDAINELHWDKFDVLMKKLDAVSEEADSLIEILSNKDLVDESGNWTDEGITSLGLYAQQMEAAEVQAKKYEEEIAYLNDNWQELGYTEEEYIDKLDELKSGQYDAINAYHDAKDAIVDLNKERINAIKKGIEKEIDAYSELIDKKKEALSAEKDLYDFKKNVADQEKNIANLQRQLKALEGNNTAAARAKKAQLEAELAEAQAALQDSYYERSIDNQQEALDKELDNFKTEKDEEIKGWEEYLENTEQVVSDSLATVQANTDAVYQTLKAMGEEYGLSITTSLTSPWLEGENAIQSFSEKFGISMSSTVDELKKLEEEFKAVMDEIDEAGQKAIDDVTDNVDDYTGAEYKEPEAPSKPEEKPKEEPKKEEKTIKVGGKINAKGAKIYEYAGDKTGANQYFAKDPIYVVLDEKSGYLKVRHHKSKSGVTGWFKKSDVKAYAKGTRGVDKDQWAQIDELGDELLVRAQNGRLTYLEKGSGVVPADLTENLMGWGKLDPSIMLDQNRPAVGLHPEIHNTQIQIDNSVAELIHIDHCDQSTLPDVEKIVNKALEKHTQKLNQSLRKYTR